MRPRRFLGILERAVLGAAMSVVLYIVERGLSRRVRNRRDAERLAEVVEDGDGFALARLRPYVLADAWGAPRRKVLEICLHATRAGLFDLRWDLLCPLCRGAKESGSTLAEMKQGAHCETCNIDFAANFDRSVELTFRASPAIRPVEERSFCVGGPQMTPHIVAQQLLAAGDRRSVSRAG